MTALEESDEYVGTCDAGHCDLPTVAVVWTGTGWLPCCRKHAQQELREADEAKPCPECATHRCRSCTGHTWDFAAHAVTDCPCAGAGHG